MQWLLSNFEALGIVCGGTLALSGVIVKADQLYRKHLGEQFATKKDFQRLEKKVDTILVSLVAKDQ